MDVKTHICRLKKQNGTFIELSVEDIKKKVEEKNIIVLRNELPNYFLEIKKWFKGEVIPKDSYETLLSKINQVELEKSLKEDQDQWILIPNGQYHLVNLNEKELDLGNNLTIEDKVIKSNNGEVFIQLNLLKGSRLNKSWRWRRESSEVKEGKEYELCFLPSKGKDSDKGCIKTQEINSYGICRVPDETVDKEFKGLEDIKGIEIDEEEHVDQVDGEKQGLKTEDQLEEYSNILKIQIDKRALELKNLNSQIKERRAELENLETGLGNVETSQEKKQEESETRVEEDSINYDQSISKLTELVEKTISSSLFSLQDNLQDNTRILQDNVRKIDSFFQKTNEFLLLYRKRQGWLSTLTSCARSILTFLVYCFMFATIMFFYFPETIDPWLTKLNIKFKLLGWKVRWPRVKRGWIRNGRIIVWFERN